MKKLYLLVLLALGLIPEMKNGELYIYTTACYGQSNQGDLEEVEICAGYSIELTEEESTLGITYYTTECKVKTDCDTQEEIDDPYDCYTYANYIPFPPEDPDDGDNGGGDNGSGGGTGGGTGGGSGGGGAITDCAGVYGGTAYLDACQTCVGGNTQKIATKWYQDLDNDGWGNSLISKYCYSPGSGWVAKDGDLNDDCYNLANYFYQCDDPCDKLGIQLLDINLQAAVTALKTKTGVGNKEWGTEVRAKFDSIPDMASMNFEDYQQQTGSIRESTLSGSSAFNSNFSPDNINHTLTIGTIHSHPDISGAINNSCFSPQDVLAFRDNYCNLAQGNNIFKEAVAVLVTAGAVFAMKINDPVALCAMTGSVASYTTQFRNLTTPGLTSSPISQEQAFQSIFGNTVKLFKQNSDGTFTPKTLNSSGNSVNGDCN